MTSLSYGAWIGRASDGMFVAELPDFPEIAAVGVNQKHAAALASVRLSAHVTALRQRGLRFLRRQVRLNCSMAVSGGTGLRNSLSDASRGREMSLVEARRRSSEADPRRPDCGMRSSGC